MDYISPKIRAAGTKEKLGAFTSKEYFQTFRIPDTQKQITRVNVKKT